MYLIVLKITINLAKNPEKGGRPAKLNTLKISRSLYEFLKLVLFSCKIDSIMHNADTIIMEIVIEE